MPLKPTIRKKVDEKIDEIIDKQIDKMVDKTLKELDEKDSNLPKSKKLDSNEQNETKKSNNDFEQNKLVFALSYLVFFLPYICAKNSPDKNFYANQGLVLLLTSIVFGVAIGLLSLASSVLGWILSIIIYVLVIAELVYGVVKTIQGQEKTLLPIIGKITIIK